MNDDSRHKWEAFVRMSEFGADNTADFPVGSPGKVQFTALANIISSVDTTAADQIGAVGDAAMRYEHKDNAREYLRSLMSAISLIARSMAYQYPGIDEQFRMPRNRNDADLLAGGRAFYANSVANEAAFITYGLDSSFRDELSDACDNFEISMTNVDAAVSDRVEAGAELGDWIVQGIRARRILDGIVRIKYATNVGKLAAWTTASHIERAATPATPTP